MKSISRVGLLPYRSAEARLAAGYFEAVHQAFLAARAAAPAVSDRSFLLRSHRVRLQFAGPALAGPLTPAFAHLAGSASGEPALTICAWDSASTGTALPPPPWDVSEWLERQEMWRLRSESVRVVYEFAAQPRLSMLDLEQNLALYWAPGAPGIAHYERAAPFLRVLHWWLRDRGLQMTHAAAVGRPGGGVLLGGKGGSGKSTTTLACLKAGLSSAGDDYVLLSAPPRASVHTVYNSAKLEATHLRQVMPELLPAVSNPEEMEADKALMHLDQAYPGQMLSDFPIRAVLLPQVRGGSASRLVPVAHAAAVAAIAPSTLFQLRWVENADFENIVRVVRSVPSYRLELGTDLPGVAAAVMSVLDEA